MATRMSGIIDSSVRQKLLTYTPFPTLEQVANLCHSEESAIRSGVQLNNKQINLAAPMIIPLFLLGGFFAKNGSVPVYLDWIRYLQHRI